MAPTQDRCHNQCTDKVSLVQILKACQEDPLLSYRPEIEQHEAEIDFNQSPWENVVTKQREVIIFSIG